jgi:hypothetical protein
MKHKHKPEKVDLFVKVFLDTLDAPAWRAMSHGARSLYVALKRRCRIDLSNNGKIFLPQRQAALELGSNRDYVARWFRELEHYGFIVMTRRGFLGIEGKGKAPHWRLTEVGFKDGPPSRDFLNWSGARFEAPKKQNPGPQTGANVALKLGPKVDHKLGPPRYTRIPKTGPQTGAISRSALHLSSVATGLRAARVAAAVPPASDGKSE